MSALEDLRALQARFDAEGRPEAPLPESTALGFTDLIGIILTGCALVFIPFLITTLEAFL